MGKMSELDRQRRELLEVCREVEVEEIVKQREISEYVSTCCNASAFGNSFIEEELTGICNKCYDGANFEDLYEEEG